MARAFVTGASGFIGGALAARLLDRGDEVVALARSDAAAEGIAGRSVREIVRGDVLDPGSLAEGMDGCDVAYHVAGVNTHCPADPAMLLRVNVEGPVNAVRAAARAGVERLVYTSSAATVGEPPGAVGDETTPHRGWYLSTYDRAKHEGEQAALAEAERLGVALVALNPSSVQGPGRASGNGKVLIDYLNAKLPVFADVHISVVDVDDCVEAHLLAAEHGRAGGRYVLNGVTLESAEALELVSELSGVRPRVRILPAPVIRGAAAAGEAVYRVRGQVPSLCRARIRTLLHGHRYDGSLAQRELGLAYTPVRETFAKTIDWAVEAGLVTRPLPARAGGPAAGACP